MYQRLVSFNIKLSFNKGEKNASQNKLWVGIDDVFLVSATTTKKALVMELLNFFASQESSEIWMNNAKLLSSNKNVSTENADAFLQNIKGFIDEGNYVLLNFVNLTKKQWPIIRMVLIFVSIGFL